MLYLVNIDKGNYNDKTVYVVYDNVINEINYYTESQLLTKLKKVDIQGVICNYDKSYLVSCNIQYNLGDVFIEKNKTSDIRGVNAIVLNKPIKLNKIRTGMVFIYKNVKLYYVSNRPTEKSYWLVSYNTGFIDNNTLKSNKVIVDINYFFRNILEIESCLKYKLKIELDLEILDVTLNYLDLSCLSRLCYNHYISYKLRGINKINYVNIGNIDLNKTNLMELNGYIKSKGVVIFDFSECCKDYDKDLYVHNGCCSDYDFCLPSTVDNLSKVVFIFNEKTSIFIEKCIKFIKLNFLGVIPATLPKYQIPAYIEQLKAKAVLMKNLDTKSNKYYVIMK